MFEAFEMPGFRGELAAACRPPDLASAVAALIDPRNALATVHWGRNYLYRTRLETAAGPCEVVVKQFRNQGPRRRLERRWRGSKAERSWRMARAFAERGIPTADPLFWIESTAADGPSYFVSRFLQDRLEIRYLLRARNAGELATKYPGLDYPRFLGLLAGALRRLHDRGLFHRDLSIGNVLVPDSLALESLDDFALIDLNRARIFAEGGVGLWARNRDLGRLPLLQPADRRLFLEAYWGEKPDRLRRAAFLACHFGFRAKLATKAGLRAPFKGLGQWILPRRAHAHIPDAPPEASSRDRIVWDHLSDQPHQHASRMDKLAVRLIDAPSHLLHNRFFVAALPRIYRRYRRLRAELYSVPVAFGGVGVGVRPYPPAPAAVGEALAELGVGHALLRLHPWQDDHGAELELARDLHARGIELCFALPQNRDLVRDPATWRRRLEGIAAAFGPYGRDFVVGQAINRSKWGVWRAGDYRRLLAIAAEVLRAGRPDVRLFGPGVIDFELHATAAVVNDPRTPPLDGLASLLYVDRRGAPENTQLGFDTVGKLLLAKAIATSARRCGPASWVTEVNWPLWEGPHSPAGKSVSVDENEQADYLVRYYLLALAGGACERVYWWQLIARGYGLMVAEPGEGGDSLASGQSNAGVGPNGSALRRRPSFAALAAMTRQLRGRSCFGPPAGIETNPGVDTPGAFLLHFGPPDQASPSPPGPGHLIVGWALAPVRVGLSGNWAPVEAIARDGSPEEGAATQDGNLSLASSVRYFRI